MKELIGSDLGVNERGGIEIPGEKFGIGVLVSAIEGFNRIDHNNCIVLFEKPSF